MSQTARKKFRFQVPPTDRQLWAVGMVIVHWSQLETFLSALFNGIIDNNDEFSNQYKQTRSFKIRLDLLVVAIRDNVSTPHKEKFFGLITQIRNAQQMRDRIAHGSWAAEPKEGYPMSAKSVFNWQKPHPAFEWKLDYKRILDTALTIDKITADLMQLTGMVAMMGAAEPNSSMLLSDALRNISRKRDQTS